MSNTPPPNGNGNGYSFGLQGWLKQFANLTAVGLICLMFWQAQQESYRLAREDRAMFHHELQVLHQNSRHQAEAFQQLTEAVKVLAEDLKQLKEENLKKP